ncbi:Leucine-rich repeat protein [Niveomyces insectorum RCEF 264]|uniref:Leucine-rich repeat protein n=1 Tax=Niveomyces insectorum RCEF 264 TaxID=1081102 RepID=A0A167QFW3_9HYPO|nr:Leucine-rich repeat protein [Niveomyces insectorum RCEF 264]
MAHAWLDSLSEDWPSQSISNASQLSPLGATESRTKLGGTAPKSITSAGRLFGSGRQPWQDVSPANSSNVLSERSSNDINIFGSRRSPSKLSCEYKVQDRGRPSRRSVSASSLGSVVHNTVDHKSQSASPAKHKGDTPEWKRRLVHGDLAYGEQRDLFSSARVGLENIFNPPNAAPPINVSAAIEEEEEEDEEEEKGGQDDEENGEDGGNSDVRAEHGEDVANLVRQDAKTAKASNLFDDHERINDTSVTSSPPIRATRYDESDDFFHDESLAQQLPDQGRNPVLETLEEVTEDVEETQHHSNDDQSVHQHALQTQNEDTSISSNGSQIRHPMKRDSRMVSGQSVLRNESFSAILISPEKNKGGDGAVFGPVELPSGELKRRLENLRWNQMMLADGAQAAGAGEQSISVGGKSLNAENTEEYEKLGGFINFRRGGRSADGSFRDRLLSPPLTTDSSEMLPEESLQASTPKQFDTVRIENLSTRDKRSPILPRAPNPSPEKRLTTPRKQPQTIATSPLKLFGPYDTFTNQTLMRRISQFEDEMSNGSRASAGRSADAGTSESHELEAEGNLITDPPEATTATVQHASRQSSAQFGAGELDGYEFSDFSSLSQRGPHPLQKQANSNPEAQSTPKPVFSSQQGELQIQRLRQSRNTTSSRPSTAERWVDSVEAATSAARTPQLATPRPVVELGSEAKRPRTSPSKDPTPKRRRTLHKSDVAFGIEDSQAALDSVQLSHHNMLSIIGRKRRDALDGDELQFADPEVLASRQILRPRTPTPSQRSSVQREQNPNVIDAPSTFDVYGDDENGGSGQFSDSNGEKKESTLWSENSLDGAPPAPASGGPVIDGERKPSIRTEDFMNEAHKIMAMLRSRGGVQSGLASLEESEMETPAMAEVAEEADDDGSFQESTKEPFSRPPSREGKPVPRIARVQEDPEVVAQLKKYEERSGLDDLVTSTTRSISMAQSAIRAEQEAARAVQDTIGTFRGRTRLDESDDISDPPNIRITINPKPPQPPVTQPQQQNQQQQQHQQHPDDPFRVRDDNPSHASQGSLSTGSFASRGSMPTGSSRGSESRKTIAPQNVSHLIPDQVANMMLDKDRNIWIRRRNRSGNANGGGQNVQSIHNVLPSEGSEEDPFADIPDLTVDVTKELHHLKPPVAPDVERATLPSRSPVKPAGPVLVTESDFAQLGGSSAAEGAAHLQSPTPAEPNNADAAVEHEFSINEGRVPQSPPSRKRHLAISFSSPIASIIQDFVIEDDNDEKKDNSAAKASLRNTSTASVGNRSRRTVSIKFQSTSPGENNERAAGAPGAATDRSRSTSRGGVAKAFSVAGQAFVPRPVSRIDEREEDDTQHTRPGLATRNRELSLIGDQSDLTRVEATEVEAEASGLASQRQTSFSVLMTTPGPAPRRANDEQVMAQYVGMLSLSPMSEFTIHHERSLALEASYVLGDRHLTTGDGSKTVMSNNLRVLVDRLAEVQPFEPYWEDMEELDVQGRSLESLHKLDEFCPRLVTVDAGNNALRNLGGVPQSVRHLRIVHNQLSDLTSWTRLANLQYLDISNNNIKTLSGLKNLVHLRDLKADNCNLESLDGIKYHDGLLTLRARGNRITSVDFDGARLHKLVELDLEGNQIAMASGLDNLVSLRTLNLRRNALTALVPSPDGSSGGTLPQRLQTLNLSDNRLVSLDVRAAPFLRLLHADRNCLTGVLGLSHTPRLDSISLREQALAPTERLDLSSLYHAYEIRKLYLSGNRLDGFEPPVDFLNLQLLELANCGLTSLPADFGRAVPNLRKLNLNFNGLAHLDFLRGIPRLKRVLVAGNRLAHAYAVIRSLAAFLYLAEVDLRDNPLTQGFYPPPSSGHSFSSSTVAASPKNTSTSATSNGNEAGSPASLSAPEPFTLPLADAALDQAYCSRLDLATAMRRRIYSHVFGDACGRLKQLDGLPVDRAIGALRDAVWEALQAKGIVVVTSQQANGIGKKAVREEVSDESRWGAEDTFA